MAPRIAPACIVVTRLPERSSATSRGFVSRPNSLCNTSSVCRRVPKPCSDRPYRLKSGIASTPPMIPASTPNSAPAKHDLLCCQRDAARKSVAEGELTDAAKASTLQL